jgi:hypothetical protein
MIFKNIHHGFSAGGGKSMIGIDLRLCVGGIGEFGEAADFSGGSSFVNDACFGGLVNH